MTERRVRIAGIAALLTAISFVCSACDRSPAEQYARLVEQSASWAASAKYAAELRDGGFVPNAYLKEVIETGASEIQKLQKPLSESTDVSRKVVQKASTLNDAVGHELGAAMQTQNNVDRVAMQRLDSALRALADELRRQ